MKKLISLLLLLCLFASIVYVPAIAQNNESLMTTILDLPYDLKDCDLADLLFAFGYIKQALVSRVQNGELPSYFCDDGLGARIIVPCINNVDGQKIINCKYTVGENSNGYFDAKITNCSADSVVQLYYYFFLGCGYAYKETIQEPYAMGYFIDDIDVTIHVKAIDESTVSIAAKKPVLHMYL